MQAKTLLLVLVLSVLPLGILHLSSSPIDAQSASSLEAPRGELVDAQNGWLLINQHLYWTEDGGQNWRLISLPDAGGWQIRAVGFPDAVHGRLVLSRVSNPVSPEYALAFSDDAAKSWNIVSHAFFSAGDVDAQTSAVFTQWLDPQSGWIVFRRVTSSSFSVGTIFRTGDGGRTWERSSAPIAEQPSFVDPMFGWLAGGPGGTDLYRTVDGGKLWHRVNVLVDSGSRLPIYAAPKFVGRKEGILATIANGSELRVYATKDGGSTWDLRRSADLGQEFAPGLVPPISLLDTQNWLAVAPRAGKIIRPNSGGLSTNTIQDPLVKGITHLQMVTSDTGWAWSQFGRCGEANNQRQCTSDVRLLQTHDGGISWRALTLPETTSHTTIAPMSRMSSPVGPTMIMMGQGFDACYAGSISAMQDWISNSPYRAVNLYIGGSALYEGCTPITQSYVSALYQQGWRFIPTWVGPQAPCMDYKSSVSYDPWTAYSQGVSEANAAIAMARSLGMAYGDFSGSIVYYDMENYNENDYACRTAVNWFLTGWAAQLQHLRSKAGAYGGAYDINASWASLTPPVDAVWIAHWTRTYYSAGESVWDSIVPDQLWNNHQRAKQYAGGHFETWGSNTLNIDSDVIDGPVASVVVPNAVSVIGVSVYDITGTLKTDVFPNEQLGLSAAINNTDPLPNPVSLQISVSGECGPFINYATVYTAPSGLSAWGEYKAAPALLCNGPATYQVIANFGGYVTTKSAPLTLHGITRRFILPLIRRY